MKFPDCGRGDLKYPAWKPLLLPEFAGARSMLDLIREEDRFLHVPYHSFDHYIQLLCEAAISPRVKSIKTTLYRLAKDSKVVEALIAAAKNGKKVTVVIELLARSLWIEIKVLVHRNESHIFYSFLTFVSKNYV